jgi:hypothetical protein
MATTGTMVQPSAITFMELSLLIFPLTCAADVCGELLARTGRRGCQQRPGLQQRDPGKTFVSP